MSDFHPLLQALLNDAKTTATVTGWQRHHPGHSLLTLQFELGDYVGHWLEYLPEQPARFCYQATPGNQEYRLGLGLAWRTEASGDQRLGELAQALAVARRSWQGTRAADLQLSFPFHAAPLPETLPAALELPALWLIARGGRAHACFSSRLEHFSSQRQAVLDQLATSLATAPPTPGTLQIQPVGDYADWEQRVRLALQAIDRGQLQKLVLARELEVHSEQPFTPALILQRLLAEDGNGLIYALGSADQCFLGATPETLVALRTGQITADALAGTAWPDSPALEDSKNCREQQHVVTAVVAALTPWCAPGSVQIAARKKCPAGQLVHWRTRINGQAQPETTLMQLAAALHPTPAVGGFPPQAAWQWLQTAGEQRTAWYSGGIGRIGADGDGQLWVALRSALLRGTRARLQAGAGIVAGSDAASEYQETGAKFGSMLAALQP